MFRDKDIADIGCEDPQNDCIFYRHFETFTNSLWDGMQIDLTD